MKKIEKTDGNINTLQSFIKEEKYIQQIAKELENDWVIAKKGTKKDKEAYKEKYKKYKLMEADYIQRKNEFYGDFKERANKLTKFLQKIKFKIFRILGKGPSKKEMEKKKLREIVNQHKQQKSNYKRNNNKFRR